MNNWKLHTVFYVLGKANNMQASWLQEEIKQAHMSSHKSTTIST